MPDPLIKGVRTGRAEPLSGPLVVMLRSHAEAQAREQRATGNLWTESDHVFTKMLGGPLRGVPFTRCKSCTPVMSSARL